MSKIPSRLPKKTIPGQVYKVMNPKTKKITCFRRTRKEGFGKFVICKCSEARTVNVLQPPGDNFNCQVGWY